MQTWIHDMEFTYDYQIKNHDAARKSFIKLIKDSFDFDFERWYELGYWTDKYEPHVLMKDNEVVATVTVNYMKYEWQQQKNYIQIGGVLTREDYRHKGLSKWLMEHIISQYKDKCDQMFLLSDDEAVDFYPKMGFQKAIEFIGESVWDKAKLPNVNNSISIRRLNMDLQTDRDILIECYKHSNPFSAFPSVDCQELVIFYGLEFKRDCYYYFPELGLVVIAKIHNDTIMIYDVYGTMNIDIKIEGKELLDLLILNIIELNQCSESQLHIQFGFTPKEHLQGINKKPLIEKDDTMFLLSGKENLFAQNELRFPILSHN